MMHMTFRTTTVLINGSRYIVRSRDFRRMMDDLRAFEWAVIETVDRSPDKILFRLDPEDQDSYMIWATTHTDPWHAGTLKDSATYEQLSRIEEEIIKELGE